MSDRERIKRPEPARTAPIRNWAGAFGPPGRGAPPGIPAYDGTGEGRHHHGAPRDPVARGVEAGYRVIDEYLRQGQSVARAMWSPWMPGFGQGAQGQEGGHAHGGGHAQGPGPAGPAPWGGPWTGAAPWAGGAPWAGAGGAPVPEEIQQRMGTMLRYATDLAMMWMDFVGMAGAPGAGGAGGVPGGAPRPAGAGPFTAGGPSAPAHGGHARPPSAAAYGPPPPPAPAPAAPVEERGATADHGTAIVLDIHSSRRVEITVDLRPRSAGLPLKASDLRPTDGGDRRLTGIRIECRAEEDQVTVRFDVPDDLPPGIYNGMIVDERTSLPRGTLSLRIAL